MCYIQIKTASAYIRFSDSLFGTNTFGLPSLSCEPKQIKSIKGAPLVYQAQLTMLD